MAKCALGLYLAGLLLNWGDKWFESHTEDQGNITRIYWFYSLGGGRERAVPPRWDPGEEESFRENQGS